MEKITLAEYRAIVKNPLLIIGVDMEEGVDVDDYRNWKIFGSAGMRGTPIGWVNNDRCEDWCQWWGKDHKHVLWVLNDKKFHTVLPHQLWKDRPEIFDLPQIIAGGK